MIFGEAARTASSPTPRRSATPGRKFCTKTSAPAARRSNACLPAVVFRSSTTDRLLRLLFRNDAVNPARRLLPARVASPPSGASTLITSAPWSPRIIVASGPATFDVRSTTRYPCNGPGMLYSFAKCSVKARHDLFAQEPQCGHYLRVGNETAAIDLRQYAVDAELVLQRTQALRHHLRCADQHLATERFVIGQVPDPLEALGPALDRAGARAAE